MYTIKREKKGEYVVLEFESEKISTDFEKRLIIQDDILRHLDDKNQVVYSYQFTIYKKF